MSEEAIRYWLFVKHGIWWPRGEPMPKLPPPSDDKEGK